MEFISFNDFNRVCDAQTIELISQQDEQNLSAAERYAIEEISSYINARYDVEKVFSVTEDERNAQVVMYCCDIALYHLISWLPRKMGYEIRETRYKRAIEWLEGVQAGKVSPDLPPLIDNQGQPSTPLRFGSWEKNNY